MSTVFTMPGKLGDAILQWPVAFHWHRETGEPFEVWLDEKTCAPLVPLLETQPGVSAVKLMPGVENYNCGGQPFHLNLPTSAFEGNTIYHLGLRSFPVRQISLQVLQDSKVPVKAEVEEFAETPSLVVDGVQKANRLVIHGQSVCPHTRSTPTMWRFLASIAKEVQTMFTEIVFVGSPADREVGRMTYPEWTAFDDGGDFLKLARFIAGSRLMIGCGSAPITVAGALKVPAIRVHDPIANDAPKVIWNNLGANQLNDTHLGLRKEWPVFKERFLLGVDESAAQA
jgi:hypothetical protein